MDFMDINSILNDLVNSLKVSDPYKIILFDEIEKTGKVIYEKVS
jgi:ATP-dependent Clp protease ATP-binding subunit ClpA